MIELILGGPPKYQSLLYPSGIPNLKKYPKEVENHIPKSSINHLVIVIVI